MELRDTDGNLLLIKNAPQDVVTSCGSQYHQIIGSFCGVKGFQLITSRFAALMGAIAGALGAAFSTNGPPVVMYGMLRSLGPAAFPDILNPFFTANNIAIIGGLATSGILTVSTVKLVIFCIPTMIIGSIIGQYVLAEKRISLSPTAPVIVGQRQNRYPNRSHSLRINATTRPVTVIAFNMALKKAARGNL